MRYWKFILLILSVHISSAQIDPKFLSGSLHAGFIIPHSSDLEEISESNPLGIQVEYSKLKTSRKAWSQCNCFSRNGFAFSYFNFMNQEELGSALNTYYFFQPYFDIKGNLTFSLRGGIGVSYLTKVYDEEENPRNIFFSSPFSFILLISPRLGYMVNDNLEITASFDYNHISNGGSSKPNKGMNFPTFSVGLSKVIDYKEPVPYKREGQLDKSIWYYAGIYGNIRSANETDTTSRHLLIGTNVGVVKPLSVINGINSGFEFSYDGSLGQKMDERGVEGNPLVFSWVLGHHFSIGKVYFFQQFGFYLHTPESFVNEDFFQRYSVYYFFTERFSFGASLLAHGHVAQHLDLRVLYRIGKPGSSGPGK